MTRRNVETDEGDMIDHITSSATMAKVLRIGVFAAVGTLMII